LPKFALPINNPIVPHLTTQFSPTREITYKTLATRTWWYHYTITALCVGKHPDLSTWGGKQPSRVDKSGCFPTQRAIIVLLYFCQCFIGYLPCGWKLGCSVGNNRVVSRQCKFLPMFYRLSRSFYFTRKSLYFTDIYVIYFDYYMAFFISYPLSALGHDIWTSQIKGMV
jgi:hypothetical protein